MIILDGNKLADKILADVKKEINEKQLKLKLAVVLIGQSRISDSYISKKREACEKAGIIFDFHNYSEISEDELKDEVLKLSQDKSVSGIVVQLPLPKEFKSQEILNLIPIEKDPDVLSDLAFEKFSNGGIISPVACAIRKIFEEYKIDLKGKKIALIGKGKLVGKPISSWLKNIGADFQAVDKSTENIKEAVKDCDIIISGAGSPGLITKDMVKEGAVLIDAGTSSEDGVIKGDIEKSAYESASYVAPVPGGVGPVAVACLLENLVKLNSTPIH